ncbi:MAG: Plug domain-containing protein [Sinobacteraceae bacterium]|nr:Plug domain-containing protein [Nevskiaceae bacterium]
MFSRWCVRLGTAALAFGLIGPVFAQDLEEIIVTARRMEERLQDVPISISVLNQQQLENRNIVNSQDLATYVPSLSANSNFGSDNSSFAIRGFVQDIARHPRSASTSRMSWHRAAPQTAFRLAMAQARDPSSICRTCRC